jgi:hypothetical protein
MSAAASESVAAPSESMRDLLHLRRRSARSRWTEKGFEWMGAGSTWFGLGVLIVLLLGVLWQGAGWLTWSFLTNYDTRKTPASSQGSGAAFGSCPWLPWSRFRSAWERRFFWRKFKRKDGCER